jgi:Icc-related predicted phosphoesterase
VRIFFASDLHGSERCFRKFLNSAAFFEADVLVLGGDLTGKAILPIVDLGKGRYMARMMSDEVITIGQDELPDLDRKIRDMGLYPLVAERERLDAVGSSKDAMEAAFTDVMRASLTSWMKLAEERLTPRGTACYLIPGNDDMTVVDEVLAGAPDLIVNVVAEKSWIADTYEVVGLDYVNPTPWHSPREASEDEMAAKHESVFATVDDPEHCIVNFHCPPSQTSLDQAPALTDDLRPIVFGGRVMTKPVGSTAMRAAIEQHQPLLGLHGHIHESRGAEKLGRTLCVNPGSDYGDGILRGAIIEIENARVGKHQFVTG